MTVTYIKETDEIQIVNEGIVTTVCAQLIREAFDKQNKE